MTLAKINKRKAESKRERSKLNRIKSINKSIMRKSRNIEYKESKQPGIKIHKSIVLSERWASE